jgi:Short C-terminal domain/Phospholipase_D-nuclease N-terminal
MVLAAEWGTGEVFWSMLWFFLWIIWFWLLITVFSDIFRSRDLSGGVKALWCIFVIVLPYLGVFIYLIVRGHRMSENAAEAARQQDAAFRQYVQEAAKPPSPADELAKLAKLREDGTITDAEYARLKEKALA